MRLSDIMSRMDLTIWPVAALVIFLGIFILIAMRTMKRPGDELASEATLPLQDDTGPIGEHGRN